MAISPPPFLPNIAPCRMLRPAFSSDLHTADMPTTFLSQADIEEGLIGERVGQEE